MYCISAVLQSCCSTFAVLCKAETNHGHFQCRSCWLLQNWSWTGEQLATAILFVVVQKMYLWLHWKARWWHVFHARCKEQHVCQAEVTLTACKTYITDRNSVEHCTVAVSLCKTSGTATGAFVEICTI